MKKQLFLIALLLISMASDVIAVVEDYEDDVVGSYPSDTFYTFWNNNTEDKCVDLNVTDWVALSNNSWNISSPTHYAVTSNTTDVWLNLTENYSSTYVNFSYYPYQGGNSSTSHGYLKWQLCADKDITTKRLIDVNIGYETFGADSAHRIFYRTTAGVYTWAGFNYTYSTWNNMSIKINYTSGEYQIWNNNGTGWVNTSWLTFRDNAAQTNFNVIYWFAPKTQAGHEGKNNCTIAIDNLYLSEGAQSAEKAEGDFFVWALSDTHNPLPNNASTNYLNAIQHTNSNITFNISINAGDVIDSHDAPYAAWTMEQKLKSWMNDTNVSSHPREDFYTICGNHEARMITQDGTGTIWDWNNFIDNFGLNQSTSYVNNSNRTFPLLNTSFENKSQGSYSFYTGNVLWIMLCSNLTNDTKNDHRAAFDFWNDTVQNASEDVSIITVTHFSLEASELTSLSDFLPNEADFVNVMLDTANHSIVAWFSGHRHYFAGDTRYNYNSTLNCTFIDISAIDVNHYGIESHSYLFGFNDGLYNVSMGDILHDNRTWDPLGNPGNMSTAFNLSIPFDLDWEPAGPTNAAPNITNPIPTNASTNVPIQTTLLNISINDSDGDTFNWTIETQPYIGNNSGNDSTNGTFICNISGLLYNTTYTWWVNATDGVNSTVTYYTFGTEDLVLENCSCPGYDYGNWTISEHVREGALEYNWTESNYSAWMPYNLTDYYPAYFGNWSYMFNNSGGDNMSGYFNDIAFTIANNSCRNRSQILAWTRYDVSVENVNKVFPFYAFDVNTTQNFSFIAFGANEVYLLHFNGYNVTDLATGALCSDNISNATNYWYSDWGNIEHQFYETYSEPLPWGPNGSWIKSTYNSYCGFIAGKMWGDSGLVLDSLFTEPAGWEVNTSLENITHNSSSCFGFGFWCPYEDITFNGHFDFINHWQLNYTLNYSANISWDTEVHPRPHADFPIINMSVFGDDLLEFLIESLDGNLTLDNVSLFMKDNITNKLFYNSRWYNTTSAYTLAQNDTIHYYTWVLDNISDWIDDIFEEPPFEVIPNTLLCVYVIDTTDAYIGPGGFDSLIVGFDLDNDRQWDDTDRMYYVDTLGVEQSWSGNHTDLTFNAFADAWLTTRNTPRNIFRYWNHTHYILMIPTYELINNDTGEPINVSEPFGLHIQTYDAEGTSICVWENWNETACDAFKNEEIPSITLNYYGYPGAIQDIIPFETNLSIDNGSLALWGEGEITGTLGGGSGDYYDIDVEKFAYDNATGELLTLVNSSMLGNNHSYIVNFTINISNTGTLPLTDIYINETWLNCSCSSWNFTLVDSNVTNNITYYNDSCYIIIHNDTITLNGGENWTVWLLVNISECGGTNVSGTITNNVSVNDTSGVTDNDSYSFSWRNPPTRARVLFSRNIYDTFATTESVVNILGIVLIIGSILAIVFIMKSKGLFGG